MRGFFYANIHWASGGLE